MAKGFDINLSFRAGTSNTESGVVDTFSQQGRPKLKFNFTVTFKFRSPVSVGGKNKDGGAFMADELTFAVKQASRPNPTVILQDVNYYNFRTKVGTKVDYGAVQLQFYDDVENFGHDIFEQYLKHISPIANIRKERANSVFAVDNIKGPQNAAFNTEDPLAGSPFDGSIDGGTGSIGPLPISPGGELGLIENITIRHWFYSQTERRAFEVVGAASDEPNIQFVEYQYLNPKVINMTLDELDMTQSEINTVMMNFTYDSVFIDSPKASATPDPREKEGDGNTFTLNDIRARVADVQRLVRRIRRLDTLPDISVLGVAEAFVPPISGNLPNIALPRPVVDALSIIGL